MARLGVVYELDKQRTIRFGIVELMKIEAKFDKTIWNIGEAVKSAGELNVPFYAKDVSTILTLLHIGLQHEDPNITLDEVARLVDEYSNFSEVMELVSEAFATQVFETKKQSKKK